MSRSGRSRLALLASVIVVALSAGRAFTQADVVDPAKGTLPNPNPTVMKNWGQLPDGRTWGSTAGVDIGPDGHVWAYDRCGANTCDGSKLDPIFKFHRSSGELLTKFDKVTAYIPGHQNDKFQGAAGEGVAVDSDGNVYAAEGPISRPFSKGGLTKYLKK